MLTGGPSVAWAKSILPDDRAALLLCGYQDEEAPGRKARAPQLPAGENAPCAYRTRTSAGLTCLSTLRSGNTACPPTRIRPALIDIIERIRPQSTMLVHGCRNQEAFRVELARKSIRTVPTDRWSSCPS